jgi:hypothetical protein
MADTLVKTFIVIVFAAGFLYCANLAFQSELEMKRILIDIEKLKQFTVVYFESF